MPVTNWNTTTIDGKPFLVIDVAKFRIPLDWDPSSNMFIAVAAPDGGLGNIPALVKGDPGDSDTIDDEIITTFIDYDDPTPESASFTEIAPGVKQMSLTIKRGAKGDPGDTVLTPSDYGTAVAGRLLRVKSDLSGFELFAPPIGDRYLPAGIANAPSGNAAYTLCQIPVDAQPFDWRPEIEGQTIFTGTGADVGVDLVARLQTTGTVNGETAGPIIGRGFGPIGTNAAAIATVFSSCPPPNSLSTYDKVLAGNTATIWVRGERRTGANTFTTSSSTSIFKVKVAPVL
jgi:hypothetical protein